MIQPIKDNRRKNAAKKKQPKPEPFWVEAFMILLLHKTGGTLTVSLADLKRFGELKNKNHTLMSFDPDGQTITVKSPEAIVKVENEILTGINQG